MKDRCGKDINAGSVVEFNLTDMYSGVVVSVEANAVYVVSKFTFPANGNIVNIYVTQQPNQDSIQQVVTTRTVQ